ncbi:EGF-like calcium-binding domain [Trinorchestia longiramus]|nr:EGF-like calcium-binding domain [Trinorchestia longiramus]
MQGDALTLQVADSGKVELSLTKDGVLHQVTAPPDVADNAWHHVFLRFELGVLSLGVDDTLTPVASSTGPLNRFLDVDLQSADSVLTVGGGTFVGCVLEGAGVPLSRPFTRHVGVQWGSCSLPDGRNCSGYDTDPCFSAPCGNHGTCEVLHEGIRCNCYTRYTGPTCLLDQGPLCSRPEHACQNGGLCQEDWRGSSTSCACVPGYTGARCERLVQHECDHNPCNNGGTCELSAFGDTVVCVCPEGVSGQYCEVQRDECASQPCLNGGQCTDLTNAFTCDCNGTGYRGITCSENIDECGEDAPCAEGATCFDLYGGYECACPPGTAGPTCHSAMDECASLPCLNEGTCESLNGGSGFSCVCAPSFGGLRCEMHLGECADPPCASSPSPSLCPPGQTGSPPNCTAAVSCDSSPCLNGALCHEAADGAYFCVCPPGYTGEQCESEQSRASRVSEASCAHDSCQNGGSCTVSAAGVVCACTPGFTGSSCQTNVNECDLGVCVHAVHCTDIFGSYECVCEEGWQGRNCSEAVDICAANPCLHNGTCTQRMNGSFRCTCRPGFTGSRCEVDRNECAGVTCLHGGTCRDGINSYTCECVPAWSGLHCTEPYDACSSDPCLQGAQCVSNDDQDEPGFQCLCAAGFDGVLCDNNIDDCVGVLCSDGHVCHDLVNSSECRCPLGFTGATCEDQVDECESTPCQNGGQCVDGLANYTCTCPPGFVGHNCESDVNECSLTPELCNHGICENTEGSYQCYCLPGYSGDHCSVEFDECLSHPCNNNGTCINQVNGYECQCLPGYTGVDCETDINECEVTPCMNGATCIDLIAAFSCVCVPGFTDTICSTNIDECEPLPCENNGLCVDGINSYACNCSDTGFKGDHCELNIDDCEPQPCQHGSNCTDLIKDHACACHPGYEGKNCEVDIPECEAVPCQFGGTCYERSNTTLYELGVFQDFSFATAGGYVCQCIPGFTGENCEINIDECESSPCEHGECEDGINSYECHCEPGYEGVNCEQEIDECERFSPCEHGSCQDLVADYTCDCQLDYGGKNCSVVLTGCQDVVCSHNGTCEALLFDETRHDFTCHCQPGFTGRVCGDSTTFSLAGSSYLLVSSPLSSEGYTLELWLRTTLPGGLLAVGSGETYFSLELSGGRLNLHSSLLNQWEGIFAGEGLNSGTWERVGLIINDSHVVLTGREDSFVHPIAPVEGHTSFTTTVLGGAITTLRAVTNGAPFLTGCLQDVAVNGERIVPARMPAPSKVAITEGCPREEQCEPNPCRNSGRCSDLWSSYECHCRRPYLGRTCRLKKKSEDPTFCFTAATLDNENSRNSLVRVSIPAAEAIAFRTRVDVSLLVRTRQPHGLIFYIGSHLDQTGAAYVLCFLKDSRAVVRVSLGGDTQLLHVPQPALNDGLPHLLQVTRDNDKVLVFVDEVQRLNATLEVEGVLNPEVMYLGGLPSSAVLPPLAANSTSLSRSKRQLGTRVDDNDDSSLNNRITLGASSAPDFSQPSLTGESDASTAVSDASVVVSGVSAGTDGVGIDTSGLNFDISDTNTGISGIHTGVSENAFDSTLPLGDNVDFTLRTPSIERTTEMPDRRVILPGNPLTTPLGESREISFPTSSTAPATVGVTSSTTEAPTGRDHFKGVLQDIRVSNGSVIRLVQPFALHVIEGEEFKLPGASFDVVDLVNVLEGTVSDAACDSNPCQNGATCNVTWNDYECTCPFGFKGKDCDELEHCARHGCPGNSTCHNLADGFECLTNRTMNGINSTSSFSANLAVPPAAITQISITYRSQVGGLMLIAEFEDAILEIGIAGTEDGALVAVLQSNASELLRVDFFSSRALDGRWHTLNVTLERGSTVMITLDSASLSPLTPQPALVDLRMIVLHGTIRLGGGVSTSAENSLTYEESFSESVSEENMTSSMTVSPFYRGCFGEVRVQGLLLPSFRPELLSNDSSPNKFVLLSEDFAEKGCRVCYEHECQHGGYCGDPEQNFTCSCVSGFEGQFCETNIDDCVNHTCQNGASCRDGINLYKCECAPGYTGQSCETEINECQVEPCLNNGTCTDGLASFTCTCMEEYIGDTCAELKINNCESKKCQNNATCSDLYLTFESQLTQVPDNYSCSCLFGFEGHNCESIIDYCQGIDCHFGTCSLTFIHPGWKCSCDGGYEGDYCDIDTDECASQPCLHEATCVDELNNFTCQCNVGWDGPTCDIDVDECALDNPCSAGSTCTNTPGSFQCDCPADLCGQTCSLPNPCVDFECHNNGQCLPQCDVDVEDQPMPLCECAEGWEGETCEQVGCVRFTCEQVGYVRFTCEQVGCVRFTCEQVGCVRFTCEQVGYVRFTCEQVGGGRFTCEQPRAVLSQTALAILIGALVGVMVLCAVVGLVVFLMMAKKKRATRGTYSPSRQEFYSPRVEMDAMMKPPPEERLI